MDMRKVAVEKLASKYKQSYKTAKLIRGYRRFEPVRGMEYVLDILLHEKDTKKSYRKRVHIVRPLSQLEIVPMPYVTESSKLNLILTITIDDDVNEVDNFLNSYAKTCLQTSDYTYLFIVFIYNFKNTPLEDPFLKIKSIISMYEKQYQNGARIAWMSLTHNNPSQFTIMDGVTKKFTKDTLLLFCTLGMDLSLEYLNRVHMNTILGWQVYFPIGFRQYKANFIHSKDPNTIDINSMEGHFDQHDTLHCSFYNQDYQTARQNMKSINAAQDSSLIDMFIHYHNLHVFQGVEPALRLKWRDTICKPTEGGDNYQRCLLSRGHGLASQSQLAHLILTQQNK